jgi:hypothetical protein
LQAVACHRCCWCMAIIGIRVPGCWYCKQNIRRQDASALQITSFQKKRNQKICKDHGYDTRIR